MAIEFEDWREWMEGAALVTEDDEDAENELDTVLQKGSVERDCRKMETRRGSWNFHFADVMLDAAVIEKMVVLMTMRTQIHQSYRH